MRLLLALPLLLIVQDLQAEDIATRSERSTPRIVWSFAGEIDGPKSCLHPNLIAASANPDIQWHPVGDVSAVAGARPPLFPKMPADNQAIHFDGKSYLRFEDPGEESIFDFEKGEAITLEAWVSPSKLPGTYAYIIGKGRTFRPGQVKENHNWSLRLAKKGSGAALSFLFRSAGEDNEYHRWESEESFPIGDGWHHIAVTYRFGTPGSLRGYIDGQQVGGKWDLGGDTPRAPMVDDDEVWIGSSMGGNKGSSFVGDLDEVIVHHRMVDSSEMSERYEFKAPPVPEAEVPANRVLVQLFEKIPSKNGWQFRTLEFAESYTQEVFAFPELPKRYSQQGIHVDRPTPMLLHAHADIVIPEGQQRLLIRSREASRLFLDDQLLTETDFYAISGEANGPIWELDRSHAPHIRPLQRGDRQSVVEIEGDGKSHRLRFEVLIGLHGRRGYMGDASVSLAAPGKDFQILGFDHEFALTETGWPEFLEWDRQRLISVNKLRRDRAGRDEFAYWQMRHARAREYAEKSHHDSSRSIDSFLAQPTEDLSQPLNDLEFLRKVCLDTIGTIPSRQHIQAFLEAPREYRRKEIVRHLMQEEGWADHWVGYWQDVLAENPNIVNPTLNNTGPFRWWIHESFLENKPFDRFVTELVEMEGGAIEGGPAGFEMASANDVPMAAKSHILGQAFLGVQMQCARCHDAPAHDILQEDLFSIAAMLKRSPEQVPQSSSIVLPPEELAQMSVNVSLKPGSKVQPAWPFAELIPASANETDRRKPGDTRAELAKLITLPENQRFAQVAMNRLWKRYMGVGLVDSVDDWEFVDFRNKELLDWLAMEFIACGYDLQHMATLILESNAYQSHPRANYDKDTFTGPSQKQLTAEQLLDSLFVISEKPYNAGQMTFDIDGARPENLSMHLGRPRRAWMFTATSNERDRPGLAMPFAAPFVTFLEQFGWRGARQNPVAQRPDDLTALQPAEFANGVLVRRTLRLSDNHVLTHLALQPDLELDGLIEELYLRIYTRKPNPEERQIVAEFLQEGFSQRLRLDRPLNKPQPDRRGMISWSNHLEQEASTIKLELEQLVRRGDLPTQKLSPEWRERLEDVLWSLLNSPEFRFSP